MTYPIFNSFVNQIQSELEGRQIDIKTFKTWHEDRINAVGLEILTNVKQPNNFIKEIAINFDWDRFRETALATQLEGLGEHPMLQDENLNSATVTPKIDVEINWVFDEQKSEVSMAHTPQGTNFSQTSTWMQDINKQVNGLLRDDEIITRWHLEIDQPGSGRRLSMVSLISYFQYSFDHLTTLNEAHKFITEQVKDLLIKSKKVRKLSNNAVSSAA